MSQYTEGVERLIAVSVEISAARDLDSIMAIVRRVARELTGADGATFVLRDGDRCFYADEDAIAPLWKGRRFPMEVCISGWCMLHRQAVAIEDIYQDERIPAEAYRPTFVKSLAMVPIRTSDPIGAIGNYWAARHRPTDQEVQLLQALADLTTVAMENVRRLKELERLAARDAFIARATTLLSRSFEYRETLADLGAVVVPAIADCYAIQLRGADAPALVALQCAEPAHEPILRALGSFELPRGHGAPHAIRTGETDVGDAGQELPAEGLVRELGLRSFVSSPLFVDGDCIGALTLATTGRSGRYFGPGDVELAVELARCCASAIAKGQLYARAQDAIRVRDEFLSIASHELRTPLTPIDLQCTILADMAADIAKADKVAVLRQAVAKIDRQNHRLQRLVNELLDVSRIMAGRLRVDLQEVDLAALVRGVVAELPNGRTTARARVELDVEPGEPIVGRWDPLRLEQVVENLVTNAIKYGKDEPVHIRLARAGSDAMLDVQDHGIGIAAAEQERIFGRFERSVSIRNYGGLGVGLFLARQFVERMGGTIGLMSELGDGATFTVRLPLAGPADEADDEPAGDRDRNAPADGR